MMQCYTVTINNCFPSISPYSLYLNNFFSCLCLQIEYVVCLTWEKECSSTEATMRWWVRNKKQTTTATNCWNSLLNSKNCFRQYFTASRLKSATECSRTDYLPWFIVGKISFTPLYINLLLLKNNCDNHNLIKLTRRFLTAFSVYRLIFIPFIKKDLNLYTASEFRSVRNNSVCNVSYPLKN